MLRNNSNMSCHHCPSLTVSFHYTITKGGVVNVVPTTAFPTSGTVTILSKYRILLDENENQIGTLFISESNYNLITSNYTVQNATYFINDVGTIAYEYTYRTDSTGTFPPGINEFPVLTTSGDYLCYNNGYITVNAQSDGTRQVTIVLTNG